MAGWLVRRKQERQAAALKELEEQMNRAAADMKKLTGPLADLGEATRKFGEAAGKADRSASTAQKIRVTDKQLMAMNDPNIDQKLRNYFMEAYRLKYVTTWGVSRDDATLDVVISWRGKREHTLRIIEDLREMLHLDDVQQPPQKRGIAMTVAYAAIEAKGKTVDEFRNNLNELLTVWQKSTGIPYEFYINDDHKTFQMSIHVATMKPTADISDDRFTGEVRELIAKAMLY